MWYLIVLIPDLCTLLTLLNLLYVQGHMTKKDVMPLTMGLDMKCCTCGGPYNLCCNEDPAVDHDLVYEKIFFPNLVLWGKILKTVN